MLKQVTTAVRTKAVPPGALSGDDTPWCLVYPEVSGDEGQNSCVSIGYISIKDRSSRASTYDKSKTHSTFCAGCNHRLHRVLCRVDDHVPHGRVYYS